MQITRLAPPGPRPRLPRAAIGLALLLNGGLVALVALLHEVPRPYEPFVTAVDVVLIAPPPEAPAPAAPEPKPRKPAPPAAGPPAAPLPGPLQRPAEKKDAEPEAAPPLWDLVCAMVPKELRDQRPDCREPGDPFAVQVGRVRAGIADQSIAERAVGDILGGRFAGKDRYQVEVMLGLRSTSLGTRYFVPVDHGPPDKPVDHTDTDRVIGPSPIPD